MEKEKKEINSKALDYRIYINENFAKFDFDKWLLENLNLAPNLKVLDLGCGTGKHLFKISRAVTRGGKVVGLDISKESLEKCRQKINELKIDNIELHKCNLINIKENVDTKFDRILSSFAIYYTHDKNKTFSDCYELLKENGILFICGPTKNNNFEFLQLIKKANGTFSKEFIKWSNFLEDGAKQLLKKIFGNVEVLFFENPIEFPNEHTLYNYWKSTASYDADIENEMKQVIKEEFKKNKGFVNKKVIMGLRCKK